MRRFLDGDGDLDLEALSFSGFLGGCLIQADSMSRGSLSFLCWLSDPDLDGDDDRDLDGDDDRDRDGECERDGDADPDFEPDLDDAEL